MSENPYALGAKKRWSKVPPEERSAMMSRAAKARYAKMSKEERSKLGKRLVDARERKRKAKKKLSTEKLA